MADLHIRSRSVALLVAAALLAGLGIGVWLFRGERPARRPGPGPEQGPVSSGAPTPAGRRETPAHAQRNVASRPAAQSSSQAAGRQPEKPILRPQSYGPTSPAPPGEEAASWEFTREDIAAAVGRVVHIGLGTYSVRAGDEFDVHVRMEAPPLQAVVLALRYDPEFVEPVPGSAVSVGETFRRGVEFFIQPRQGRMALFCATYPGKKNVLACVGTEVARFRLRAKKSGVTRVEADTRGLKCVTGDGTLLPVDVSPAQITIEEKASGAGAP